VHTILAPIAEGLVMSAFWTGLPRDGVVQLLGVDRDRLRDLPPSAPAAVFWRPGPNPHVGEILDELDRTALSLFPAWLPGAEAIEGPGGLGVAAVRSLARRQSAQSPEHGPFLADLAERALRGRATGVTFPDALRAAGLARAIASASGRNGVALIVDMPADWAQQANEALLALCGQVARLGHVSVWFIGAGLDVTTVRTIRLREPSKPQQPPEPQDAAFLPQAGQPHPGSPIEQALEAALFRRAWAAGRQWNQTYRIHTLANPIRLDLLWPDERLNVEIDGPEHLDPAHFAADRRRDVDLQLAGYAVLRFTNAEILHDVEAVVARIERFINGRRKAA
jgi:very-short-patch-repair endonuclease